MHASTCLNFVWEKNSWKKTASFAYVLSATWCSNTQKYNWGQTQWYSCIFCSFLWWKEAWKLKLTQFISKISYSNRLKSSRFMSGCSCRGSQSKSVMVGEPFEAMVVSHMPKVFPHVIGSDLVLPRATDDGYLAVRYLQEMCESSYTPWKATSSPMKFGHPKKTFHFPTMDFQERKS